MHRVQLLLPLCYDDGGAIPRRTLAEVRRELTERFGGVTAWRAPAQGWWRRGERTRRDDIVVVEVMVARVDAPWWRR